MKYVGGFNSASSSGKITIRFAWNAGGTPPSCVFATIYAKAYVSVPAANPTKKEVSNGLGDPPVVSPPYGMVSEGTHIYELPVRPEGYAEYPVIISATAEKVGDGTTYASVEASGWVA